MSQEIDSADHGLPNKTGKELMFSPSLNYLSTQIWALDFESQYCIIGCEVGPAFNLWFKLRKPLSYPSNGFLSSENHLSVNNWRHISAHRKTSCPSCGVASLILHFLFSPHSETLPYLLRTCSGGSVTDTELKPVNDAHRTLGRDIDLRKTSRSLQMSLVLVLKVWLMMY